VSGGQVGLDIGARGRAHALHAGRVAIRLLVVQVAPEQELHLLGRQRAVRAALEQRARALAVALADLLRARARRSGGARPGVRTGLHGEPGRWLQHVPAHARSGSLAPSAHGQQVDVRLARASSRLLARSGRKLIRRAHVQAHSVRPRRPQTEPRSPPARAGGQGRAPGSR